MRLKTIFKKILTERKNVGTVYHFTAFSYFLKIIHEDFLKAKGPWYLNRHYSGKSLYTVSTTRDKNFVRSRSSVGKNPIIGGTDICIALDGNKMSDSFKVVPYDDTVKKGGQVVAVDRETWGDEMEELWIGPKIQRDGGIRGIRKYIKKIIISKNGYEILANNELEIQQNGSLRFVRYNNEQGAGQKLQMIVDYLSDFGIGVDVE